MRMNLNESRFLSSVALVNLVILGFLVTVGIAALQIEAAASETAGKTEASKTELNSKTKTPQKLRRPPRDVFRQMAGLGRLSLV